MNIVNVHAGLTDPYLATLSGHIVFVCHVKFNILDVHSFAIFSK